MKKTMSKTKSTSTRAELEAVMDEFANDLQLPGDVYVDGRKHAVVVTYDSATIPGGAGFEQDLAKFKAEVARCHALAKEAGLRGDVIGVIYDDNGDKASSFKLSA